MDGIVNGVRIYLAAQTIIGVFFLMLIPIRRPRPLTWGELLIGILFLPAIIEAVFLLLLAEGLYKLWEFLDKPIVGRKR